MIKVLQVLEVINENSGVSAVVMNYYRHIDHTKIQFDFISHTDISANSLKIIDEIGSKAYRMPDLSGKNIVKYKKKLNAFFSEHRGEYQIIHGHLPNAAMFYMSTAKKYGIKIRILHSHNSMGADSLFKRFRNYIMNNIGVHYSTHYMACSEVAGTYLFGKNKNVMIIRNAIDLQKFAYSCEQRKLLRAKYGIEDNTIVIGHIGRFQKQKNHRFIIEIAKCISDQNVKFVLLGDGPDRQEIEKEIKLVGIDDQFIILGVVADSYDYYNMMDVFILPSLYEGLPVVAIEAQTNGVRCILSDKITDETIVSDKVSKVSIKDAKHWEQQIMNTVPDNDREIPEGILKKYNIEIEAEKLQTIYQNMVLEERNES